ncbi:hypothetical protein [Clostridium grantii]|uniref:Uncharacterized protein n=1 Tax=Clostridium grantii DSM 8605 TaxID=1121316 RepID=A0A1M5S663_9CLOT|nr:hypothetical protein [Clostridium grantii]SHH33930.1 hypothetical protein SAMN02745207_00771 [Clostridium grantii DSM 8605]
MENDKIFNLMEKMYIHMQEGFQKVNSEISELKSDVNGLKQEANKTNTIIENEIKPKIEDLFDGYMQNSEKIDTIDRKIDKLQLDVNSLTIRTVNNDSSIINLRNELKVVK